MGSALSADSIEKFRQYCDTHADAAEDIERLREIQNDWQAVDEDGVRAYFHDLLQRHPESPRHHYLYGRLVKDRTEAILHARRAIDLSPAWVYGYRLLMNTYSGCLFHHECRPEVRNTMAEMLEEDADYFERVFDETPGSGSLLGYVFEYYLHMGAAKNAKAVIAKAKKLKQDWALDQDAMLLVRAAEGNEKALRRYVTDLVNYLISRRQIKPSEKDAAIVEKLLHYYRFGFAYERGLEMLRAWREEAPKEYHAGIHFDMARFHGLLDHVNEAYEHLKKAVELGFDDVERAEHHSCLDPIRPDPRWPEIVNAIQENWERDRDERRARALAKKVDFIAPDFALPDDKGNTVRLKDLEGYVVVLEFWSTNCQPCRKGMPELSDFTRKDAREGVKVFSVNVRNENPAYARAFLDKRRFKTTLLLGGDEIKRAYEVESIPTTFVIDPEGHIRYRENGHHFGIRERLNWWTEELLEEYHQKVRA